MGFGSEGTFHLVVEIENGMDAVRCAGVTVFAQKLLLCSITHTHLSKVQLGRYSRKYFFYEII